MSIQLSTNINSSIIDCKQLTIQTNQGERTILPNHISFLSNIKKDSKIIYIDSATQECKAIDLQHGGVIYFTHNKASILIKQYER